MTSSAQSRLLPPSAAEAKTDPHDEATLALLGHDLRAALSDVIGGLRLIEPDHLDPMTRIQIERVRAAAEGLARLLEHGLTAASEDSPASAPQALNLQAFLTDLDLRWSGRSLETSVGFSLLQAPDLPHLIRLDRVALDRVLSNLLGNAFKYCDRGHVVCEVSVRDDGGVSFVVRDDGPGFPPDVLDRTRAALPGPDPTHPVGLRSGGSGMGLRIARSLTEQMGGKLTLRNPAPCGTEARVDLPGQPPLPPLPDHGTVDLVLAGKRVLIAEDNPTSQAILTRFVSALGAAVVLVGDGVEALERLQAERFDLLIVDVEMPRMSGLDVVRRLRAMPGELARLPVIAVTAYMMRSNRQAILAAGASDMVSKPLLCLHAFGEVVRRVLNGVAAHADAAPAASGDLPMDESRLYRLLDLAGPDTAQDILDRLMSDLSAVERGLVQAGPLRDWPAIRSQSHILMSLAGTVGAQQLQADAEMLNQLAHRMDRGPLTGQMHGVLVRLDALIQFVSQVRDLHLVQAR